MDSSKAKTVGELFTMACEACDCSDPSCGLAFYSRCHREAGTRIKFFKGAGILEISCVTCAALVGRIDLGTRMGSA